MAELAKEWIILKENNMSEEIIQEEIVRIYDRDEDGKPGKSQLD